MKYSVKKNLRNIILVGSISLIILIVILSLNDFPKIVSVIKKANIYYLLIAVLLLLIYQFSWPFSLMILTKSKKVPIKMKDVYRIGLTENFFNGITPFATGGQPFQVYAFSKHKVKPAESTSLLLMNFIIMMLASNTFAIASLVFYKSYIKNIENFQAIAIIGFLINFSVLLMCVSFGVSKKVGNLIVKMSKWLFQFIKPLRKHKEKNEKLLTDYLENMRNGFSQLFMHKKAFFITYFVKLITLFIYYLIPFFVLKAFNVPLRASNLLYVTLGTSFAITAVVFVPTPGASGGIEIAFEKIFNTISGVTHPVALASMFLYRVITYYFLLLVSFISYLRFEKSSSLEVEDTKTTDQVIVDESSELIK